MPMGWKEHARRAKEARQRTLLKEQAKIAQQKEAAEKIAAALVERAKEEQAEIEEANRQAATAKVSIERATNQGVEPFPAHTARYVEAQRLVASATRRRAATATQVDAANAAIPEVPSVPTLEGISLTRTELLNIAIVVLVDVFKLNKWAVLAIVSAGTALLYLAEKQGWTDFINF